MEIFNSEIEIFTQTDKFFSKMRIFTQKFKCLIKMINFTQKVCSFFGDEEKNKVLQCERVGRNKGI